MDSPPLHSSPQSYSLVEPANDEPVDLLKILNQTQQHNEQSIQHMEVAQAKSDIQALAQRALSKFNEARQQQLLAEIQSLREDADFLQKHFHELNEKYAAKRNEANQYLQQCIDLSDKYDHLAHKYLGLESKFKRKEQELVDSFNTRLEEAELKFQDSQKASQSKIRQLEASNKNLAQLLASSDESCQNLTTNLQNERSTRTKIQNELTRKIEELEREINEHKGQVQKLKKQISEKTKLIGQKNDNMISMQKSMKEMHRTLVKVEVDAKRQILREKSKAKKALDGLQMTRKYSEIELRKSRKKEQYYQHNQRELLGKIKEISKQQSSVINETMEKTYRKSSIKSLNTTLKLSKPEQTHSPFVSKFVVEDEQLCDLSPINRICPGKQHSHQSSGVGSRKSNSRPGTARCQIEIPATLGPDPHGAGTPCFESQKQKMFKGARGH